MSNLQDMIKPFGDEAVLKNNLKKRQFVREKAKREER